ncbi:late embryogenesis abundant protein D-7 [Lathyrus oleraceus]|uniref:Uncharacterized protein n=2 Tax=Pisum sativum TaxID=3888 RepID=A0A9D5BQR7_PEA|nr:late embryogenesis abundant protein D-7-like [Pisum sativum]KAI5447980.1 hypothetical protein KIW84_015424 [Pisum sativum]
MEAMLIVRNTVLCHFTKPLPNVPSLSLQKSSRLFLASASNPSHVCYRIATKTRRGVDGVVVRAAESISEGIEDVKKIALDANEKTKEAAGSVFDQAKEGTNKAVEAAKSAGEKAKDYAFDANDKAKEAAGSVVDKATEGTNQAVEAIESAGEKARDYAYDAKDKATEAVGSLVDKTKEGIESATEALKNEGEKANEAGEGA